MENSPEYERKPTRIIVKKREPVGAGKGLVVFVWTFVGAFLGYMMSYFFQDALIRNKLNLAGYLEHFFDIMTPQRNMQSVAVTAWIGIIVGAVVCGMIAQTVTKGGKRTEVS